MKHAALCAYRIQKCSVQGASNMNQVNVDREWKYTTYIIDCILIRFFSRGRGVLYQQGGEEGLGQRLIPFPPNPAKLIHARSNRLQVGTLCTWGKKKKKKKALARDAKELS